ncbi:MAG: autotransporter-associated beta strand repeat-containing protein [Verrucomicrobiales bacterium]|jgi:fibronectin-binding autotransporter adhesin|nr:autotransporter-associated beta strand repeat-containing protein [Verrucomicrobiales bacterium]
MNKNTNKTIKGLAVALSLSAAIMAGAPSAFAGGQWDGSNQDTLCTDYVLGSGSAPNMAGGGITVRYGYSSTMTFSGTENILWLRLYDQPFIAGNPGNDPPWNSTTGMTINGPGALVLGGHDDPNWGASGIALGADMSYYNNTYHFNTDLYVGGNFNANNYSLVVLANNSAHYQNNLLVFGTEDDRKHIRGLQTNASGTVKLQLFGSGDGVIHDHLGDGTGQGASGYTTLSLSFVSTATWTLTGSNTFTGATQVMGGGRLVLDHASLNTPKLGGGELIMGGMEYGGNGVLVGAGGATVEVIGSDSAAGAETVAALTLLNGGNKILLTGNGPALTFNTGSITRGSVNTGGATIDFQTSGADASFTTTNADGDLGAWATLNGSDYATVSGGVIGAATYGAWSEDNNVSISASESQSDAAAKNLKIAAPLTLTLTGNNTLTDGGILFAANAGEGNATISGGTLTAGGGEFVIQQHNTAGGLEITSALSAAQLTKAGDGALTVTGTVGAGLVNINGGTVKLGADNVFAATGTISLNNIGTTLDLNGHDLTTAYLLSANLDAGYRALQENTTAVVGNFAAGTESTLTLNSVNYNPAMNQRFFGDVAEGAGAVLNITKTGGGYYQILVRNNNEGNNLRGGWSNSSLHQIYDVISGNVSVMQGGLYVGHDLYTFGGLNIDAGAIFGHGAGDGGQATTAFTRLTGAGQLAVNSTRAGVVINLDGSADTDNFTGTFRQGTVEMLGYGTQFIAAQNSADGYVNQLGLVVAGKALVITPGLVTTTGFYNDFINAAPLMVAGGGVAKLTGTAGVVAGVGGGVVGNTSNAFGGHGLMLAGGTIWIAPEGAGQDITVSGMTVVTTATTNFTGIVYGRTPFINIGNLRSANGVGVGSNGDILLDRGGNLSLDFQLGNAANANAIFTRVNNATLTFTAAHGLVGFGASEKLTLFGDAAALPALTNDIINTSILAVDGTSRAGSFLTTAAVTGGVVFQEAAYSAATLDVATAADVVKVSASTTLAANATAYALRNDSVIANSNTLTLGAGDVNTQTGLIMNSAAITSGEDSVGVIDVGSAELTLYVSGSNVIENKLLSANTDKNNVVLTLFGDGLLRLAGSQTFQGRTYLNSGVLEVANLNSNWSPYGSIWLQGGVLQTSGIITRSLTGSESTSIMWLAGGFAASEASRLTVNIGNNGQTLTWQAQILSDYTAMTFGSRWAQGEVLLVNNVDLGQNTYGALASSDANYNGRIDNSGGALFRQIEVVDNPDTTGDYATISGVISSKMDYKGIQKIGDGMLMLYGVNTYTGPTSIAEGTLAIIDDSGLGAAPSAAAPLTGYVNQGTVLLNGGATLLAGTDLTINANRNILLASGNDGARGANIAVYENATATFGGRLGESVGEQGSLLVNGVNIGGLDSALATGTLRLTGTSTISGFTEVAQGTLLVDGGLTTANVVIDAGATLGGAGELATSVGGITVSGILDATDALTLSLATGQKLDFAADSTLLVDANSALNFAVAGNWLTGSGNATLELTGDFDYATQYTVLTNITTEDFSFATISGYDTANYEAQWGLSGNSYILSFDVIPEPSTWALLVTGVALLTILRRRR